MRISDWSSDVCSSDLVGQVHDAGNGKSRASRTNCLNQLLGLGQGKTTNPVNLLGNHHFTGLKIGNHTQQIGAVGTGTRSLLPIDCREIIARCLRLVYDGILRSEEHTSELQSLIRISSAVLFLTKKQKT